MNSGKDPFFSHRYVAHAIFAGAILILQLLPASGQEPSLVVRQDSPLRKKIDPHKASIYSAIIPGLGQAYNGRYWKIPILYGGFAGLGAMVIFYDNNYSRYRTALQYRTDGIPETIDEFSGDQRFTPEVLTSFKDFYRRNRDRSVIFMFALYALNIIDATVDAHFLDFDVGEDLSLKLEPLMQNTLQSGPLHPSGVYGVKLNFRF